MTTLNNAMSIKLLNFNNIYYINKLNEFQKMVAFFASKVFKTLCTATSYEVELAAQNPTKELPYMYIYICTRSCSKNKEQIYQEIWKGGEIIVYHA